MEDKMPTKIDLKKEWKHLYNPSKKEPAIVEVPSMNFLMLDGRGDPNTSQAFQDTMSTLYPLSYGLKFAVKKTQEIDYTVMPPEGLWWTEDMAEFNLDDKDNWQWTLMIMQPVYVTPELVDEIRAQVAEKKNPPLIDTVRFEPYYEGASVQIMHIGPYDQEAPNIARMHTFAQEHGYQLTGKHHEIYLSDIKRTAPERLKTILRQPIHKP
jgi:hypothetical protein